MPSHKSCRVGVVTNHFPAGRFVWLHAVQQHIMTDLASYREVLKVCLLCRFRIIQFLIVVEGCPAHNIEVGTVVDV